VCERAGTAKVVKGGRSIKLDLQRRCNGLVQLDAICLSEVDDILVHPSWSQSKLTNRDRRLDWRLDLSLGVKLGLKICNLVDKALKTPKLRSNLQSKRRSSPLERFYLAGL
jgi:hypothetical protein